MSKIVSFNRVVAFLVLGCLCVAAVSVDFIPTKVENSFSTAPIRGRSEYVIPYKYKEVECIEVESRRRGRIEVQGVSYRLVEVPEVLRRTLAADPTKKAIVFIVGVDGDVKPEKIEIAIIKSLPRHLDLFRFHEGSVNHLEYE